MRKVCFILKLTLTLQKNVEPNISSMYEYFACPFDLVNNIQYKFQKLYINGRCQFDDFMEDVEIGSSKKDKGSLKSIFNYMDNFSDNLRLPYTKFRKIELVNRFDVFEFKKDAIRVYVILQKPNIFIVLGGYKKNQTNDINKLSQLISEYKISKL